MLFVATACLLGPLLSHHSSVAAPAKHGKRGAREGARPKTSAAGASAKASASAPVNTTGAQAGAAAGSMANVLVDTRGDATASASESSTARDAPAVAGTPVSRPSSATGAADVLTLAHVRPDPGASTIGTCDPAEREKGIARIGVAHVNELRARYGDAIGGRSRHAYVAGLLRELKAAQPTLVLDAGGDYEKGALADLRSMGETTRQMIQALPIDVRAFGSHDFAYGESGVLRDARLSKHPVLAANVTHVGLPPSKQPFRPYARFDVGCVKVGVIGLVGKSAGVDDQPTSLPYDGVFAQDDHYQAILEREAKAHRSEVDVLVALTHLGYGEDAALARRGGRLVDLIIGAHSGKLLERPEPVAHPDNTRTWVLQAGHSGDAVGRGELVVKLGEPRKLTIEKYKVVAVNEASPVAEDVDALAKRLQDAVVPNAHAVIGRLAAPIKKGRGISDLVWRAAASTWNLDALVVRRDLYSAGLPNGEITLQRLYDAVLVERLPAGTSGASSLWVVELSGAEMNALARAFRPGASYDWLGPKQKLDPAKRYRLGLDKRAATYPKVLFGAEAKHVRPVLIGEMIDALEPYARARTENGRPIDGP